MTPADLIGMPFELDELDQGIIELLRLDGRMAFNEISKRLDIPETTARYRVQRLLQSKVIHITAWPNPERTGKPHLLILLLRVENGRSSAVAQELTAMDEVRFVSILAGRFNIAADVYFGVHTDLLDFFDKLDRIQGIQSYESHTVLKMLKAEYQYMIG